MHIAVNTRFLIKDKMEGFGWYTHEVFQRIVNQHPNHDFTFIFDRPFDSTFIYAENVKAIKTFVPARHPILFDWHFNKAIPRILKKIKADIFVSPDGYMSLTTDTPQIGVIHDLNFEHFPQDLKPHIIRYYRTRFPKFAHKAKHLLTVSEYSKHDIVKTYGIAPEKITVAYNGADDAFVKSEPNIIDEFRKKYNLPENYFLAVGSIHPRKNIQRLVKAFDVFNEQNKNYRLLIVGSKYQWTEEMTQVFESCTNKNNIIFTGHLTKEELIKAYSGASALIFPSYFEGFGIPIVEAMRCQCPVICANATSFPEVAGDAAMYFDPFSIESITNALTEFSKNEQLKLSMIEKGKIRVQQFSWDKTAKTVWEVIEKIGNA